jgi:UDP-hydrolysing UDP-N-acetyl-D-glucosamine 2-epimerase
LSKKICVVTGSRSDYGLLYWPLSILRENKKFNLSIIVTGMHLATQFGETWQDIERDGFEISAKVDMYLSGDAPVSIANSVGIGVAKIAKILDDIKPDLLLVLGDRYEIYAATQAAMFLGIPIAHIGGGDVTEGSIDDSIRHSISKMSHIHFVSNSNSALRLARMGEIKKNIHLVGSPGIDRIKKKKYLEKKDFFSKIKLSEEAKTIMVAFHPATLERINYEQQVQILLSALKALSLEIGILVTGSNSDTGGVIINEALYKYSKSRKNTVFYQSLGSELYLDALNNVDLIVGNSSSALYEAPSFGLRAINIGSRQKGRLTSTSILNCPYETQSILDAINFALSLPKCDDQNPYGDGFSSSRIVSILEDMSSFDSLIQKRFSDE